ncbi:hypothetical protein CPB83DRAFT_766762 [Crepidotus variabilis]|uniref:DASH complex subunit DAD2 n=1 Tax=Crepidotus variabilis TaxID=179855 RepID=A0A9P6JPT9_9AGAR|nr:hypothetical protein CPB83DRAFT_766762 [Crepidotus variabilis]
MRQSLAPNRASTAASSGGLAKLTEKKKEYDAVAALERASALYLERIEALGEDCDIMSRAGEVHGQVLDQWPKMFQILSLFRYSAEDNEPHKDETSLEGQRLVRVPLDELQEGKDELKT